VAGSIAGAFAVVGFLTFYAAMAAGPMGVLSPAIATMQAAVPVAVGVTFGARLGPLGWTGILAALIAAGLLGSPSEASDQSPVVSGGSTDAHQAPGSARLDSTHRRPHAGLRGHSRALRRGARRRTIRHSLMPGLVELGADSCSCSAWRPW